MAIQRKSAAPRLASLLKRKARVRGTVSGSEARPRLSVFRSGKNIYCQVIDDVAGKTLVSASTVTKGSRGEFKDMKPIDAAKRVGALVAQACKAKNIDKVAFDRNGYIYHGRVKVLADAAREAGLNF